MLIDSPEFIEHYRHRETSKTPTLLVAIFTILLISSNTSAGILWESDFESNNMEAEGWRPMKSGPGSSVELLSRPGVPACSGNRSMRFKVDYTGFDTPSFRAQAVMAGVKGVPPYVQRFEHGRTYWISYAFYIPSAGFLPADEDGNSFFSMIKSLDKCDDINQPGAFSNGLIFENGKQHWRAVGRKNLPKCADKSTQQYVYRKTGPEIRYDDWNIFVYKVKFSLSKGEASIWVNGENFVQYSGPLGQNNDRGPYPQFGIYKASWRGNTQKSATVFGGSNWGGFRGITTRFAYMDDWRIGDERSSYDEVVVRSCGYLANADHPVALSTPATPLIRRAP